MKMKRAVIVAVMGWFLLATWDSNTTIGRLSAPIQVGPFTSRTACIQAEGIITRAGGRIVVGCWEG